MIRLQINNLDVSVEEGSTLLEAARFLGFPIPTLCHSDGLSPYGACRLCVVEIGEGPQAKLVSSCTYPVEEGLKVRTASARVIRARKMILELLLASCPQSKTIQDLASKHAVRKQRFKQEYENCILCGLCVRMLSDSVSGASKESLARPLSSNPTSVVCAAAVCTSARPANSAAPTTNRKKRFAAVV